MLGDKLGKIDLRSVVDHGGTLFLEASGRRVIPGRPKKRVGEARVLVILAGRE
jgi:hypothetical protein